MQEKAARKKSVNLSIDAELAAEAKEFGANMSALLEKALQHELRAQREQKWREQNKSAMNAYDKHIEKDGLWLDEFRTW
jgi:antitoxin CcdA